MEIEVIKQSLLDADTQYIAHQCNCISHQAKGIAGVIFTQYPKAGYTHQPERVPGTISVHYQHIINMYAQWYPGQPMGPDDGTGQRFDWFRQSLFEITKIEGIQSIAFPYGIGCGLAGGNWKFYHMLLERFDEYVTFDVKLYQM